MIFRKLSDDILMVRYILYQVRHGVSFEDVLKNLGYIKKCKE